MQSQAKTKEAKTAVRVESRYPQVHSRLTFKKVDFLRFEVLKSIFSPKKVSTSFRASDFLRSTQPLVLFGARKCGELGYDWGEMWRKDSEPGQFRGKS